MSETMRYEDPAFNAICNRLDDGTATPDAALAYLGCGDISIGDMPSRAVGVLLNDRAALRARVAELEAREREMETQLARCVDVMGRSRVTAGWFTDEMKAACTLLAAPPEGKEKP